MLHSIENITINGVDLAYEFNDESDIQNRYFIVNEVSGRDSFSPELSILTPTLVDGGYASHRRLKPRVINAVMTIKGRSYDDMHSRVERLIEVVNTDGEDVEITFGDEPGRPYYGQVTDMEELEAKSRILKVRIEITCVDPFKYGHIIDVDLDGDEAQVTNGGRAITEPTFELMAKKKATFAMVTRGSEDNIVYNLIGSPADDDTEVVDARQSVLYENGSTLDTWQHTTERQMISHDINIDGLFGTMGTDSAGIRVETRGGQTSNRQNGPAIFKELPNAIQDFEIESTFDIISRREIENWRMMIYFLDENLNNIGHMGVKDNSRNYKRRTALSQLGQHQQGVSLIGDNSYVENYARDTTLFYLRFKREGQKFTVYIAHWRNHRHETIWQVTYIDRNNEFQGRLKYITLFLGRYQDRVTPNRYRINSVEVFELSQTTVDQTPYIIYPGDVVTLDHKNREVLLNGGPRDDLLNFGGDFFKMKKGLNGFTVTPEDTFDTKIRYTEKFL